MNGTEENADYTAFILDKMHTVLTVEEDPFEDLSLIFRREWASLENKDHYAHLAKHKHLTRQYKVYITPTLNRFDIATYEEGNHVLRLFKDHIYHFIRIQLSDENQEV